MIYTQKVQFYTYVLAKTANLPEFRRQRRAVYKSGTGRTERGHQCAGVGTWDLRTRDEVLEDIKFGTRGREGRGRVDVKYRDAGDAGCE